ncbi:P protein-like [Aphomia sociella]
MSHFWKSLKQWVGVQERQSGQELNRSTYSLVSSGELTEDTLNLWLGLPDEVKNDPEWAPFKQMYEKEHGNPEQKAIGLKRGSNSSIKRQTEIISSPDGLKDELLVPADNTEVQTKNNIGNSENEDRTTKQITKRKPKLGQSKYYIKMTILLACWLFFTSIFIMYNEKREFVKSTALINGENKNYTLHIPSNDVTILVKLSGPFLSEHHELKTNSNSLVTYHKMEVWLERWSYRDENDLESKYVEGTKHWLFCLQDENQLDFNEGESRSHTFRLKSNSTDSNHTYALRMRSSTTRTIPFTLSYTVSPLDVATGVVYALVLLIGLYVLIIFEIINRTMAAIFVATMSLAALSLVGERPSLTEIISWLNAETLLLLFSMMLLVAIVAETGIFDFLAVFAFEVTKGKLWHLIYLLCGLTAFLSTFLDNVTTVLLMSPVAIRLCEVMDLDPVPLLMFMAIYSNVGGAATPVGDPPNVIVVSDKAIIEAGITFADFTAHMSFGILLVFIQTSLQIRYIFRETNNLRLNVPRDIQDIRHQISIWRRAADSLPHLSKGVHVVRERLKRKIGKLNDKLGVLVRESSKRACPKETFQTTLADLKGKFNIRDKVLLLKSSVAIAFVVVMFFLHSIPELNRVSLSWTALLGAILLLVLADREDLEPILHRVEWSTLLFFAALFVLMEALSKLGLILYIGGLLEQLILMVDEEARLAVAITLILWVSGTISACVDNIPLTTMMLRVVVAISANHKLNLSMSPLIWALVYGACLGGNGTLIGASANVVCAGIAEQHGYKLTYSRFFRVGFPIMIGHLVVSTAYLLISHCLFKWH